MRIYELKTDPVPFCASIKDLKPFEIRANDRDFKVGDWLILKETYYSAEQMKNPNYKLAYTGRQVTRIVTCVIEGYGLQPGYVGLGLRNL